MDSLSCDAMGKSYPQSNFGQINKVTATLMILLDAKFASKDSRVTQRRKKEMECEEAQR